jgi:peptide/nickel transport system substrate-binding protein
MRWSCIALLLCAAGARAETQKDTVVMAKPIDDMISLDPAEAFEFSGSELVANLYDRLIGYDVKDVEKLFGELAESWSVGPDGKTYTFKIRPNVKFHSGNPVTAEDAAFSFRRVVQLNKTPAFILTQFGFTPENAAQRIRATDPRTLVVETDKAVAPSFFYYALTAVVASVVDSKLAMEHGKGDDQGNEWLKTNDAGSGAFKLRSWRANESYTLDSNAGWYRGAPKIRRLVARHVVEPATQRLLLEKGDVDYARSLTKDQLDSIRRNKDLAIDQGNKGSILYVGLNQRNPILAKPEVREALKWLVDYDAIEKNILAGRFVKHETFLPRGFLGAIQDAPYKLDVKKAKALLAKAGYPDGFSTTLFTRSEDTEDQKAAVLIQESLGKIGVKVTIQKMLTAAYADKEFGKRDMPMFFWNWISFVNDPYYGFTFLAQCKQGTNFSNYCDPKVDALIQKGMFESNAAKRASVSRQIQRMIADASPNIGIGTPDSIVVMGKSTRGWFQQSDLNARYYTLSKS